MVTVLVTVGEPTRQHERSRLRAFSYAHEGGVAGGNRTGSFYGKGTQNFVLFSEGVYRLRLHERPRSAESVSFDYLSET